MNGKTFQGIVRQEKFEISFLLVLRILIVCRLVIQIAIRRRVFYRNVFFDRLLIGEAYANLVDALQPELEIFADDLAFDGDVITEMVKRNLTDANVFILSPR